MEPEEYIELDLQSNLIVEVEGKQDTTSTSNVLSNIKITKEFIDLDKVIVAIIKIEDNYRTSIETDL